MKLLNVMKKRAVMDLLSAEFAAYADKILTVECLPIEQAVGRTLADNIYADDAIPSFRRSIVDGYAVCSRDTDGCSESMPSFLRVLGSSIMGEANDFVVQNGHAVYVPTGGMVPTGADAMVMIEYTELMDDEIAISNPVAPRENIIDIGDDVCAGELLFNKGQVIGTHHVGVLGMLGMADVQVFSRPKVAIISTGDELVDFRDKPKLGQIRDVNTLTLSVFVEKLGCETVLIKRAIDDKSIIRESLLQALETADVVLISGGSSVGEQDCTAEVINTLGVPGVLVHGVAIKPGKPTIAARIKNKAIFGMPGHPAACIIAFQAIVAPFISNILLKNDIDSVGKETKITARAAFQISFGQGRDVYQMVRVKKETAGYVAYPVHGKSGMVSLLSQADGYVEIPMAKEGICVGEELTIKLF